jgi:hypothetical protein
MGEDSWLFDLKQRPVPIAQNISINPTFVTTAFGMIRQVMPRFS